MSKKPDKISRRSVLGSIGAIGAGSAIGGLGTQALFNDEESVSSTFTAGELNLKLDWRAVMNGEEISHQETPVNVSDQGQVVADFNDLKQCDELCLVFSIHAESNPAWVWFGTDITDDSEGENGINDPESDAGDTTMNDGELDDFLQARAFYDDNSDCEFNDGAERPLNRAWRYLGPEGLLTDIGANGGVLLDGVRNEDITSREQAQKAPYDPDDGIGIHATPFFQDEQQADAEISRWWGGTVPDSLQQAQVGTQYLAIQIRMPCEQEYPNNPVNQAQGDKLKMSFNFYAEQARHNGFPKSPWNGSLPDVSVDAVPGVEPDDGGDFGQVGNGRYHVVSNS